VLLPLTEQQRERLRAIREDQLTDWRAGSPQVVDEMFVTDEVVRLMSGMGRACYLGLDGRVWVGNLGEGMLPWVLDDPREVASCIVRWSGCIGLPELVIALSPTPEGGTTCPLCESSREMPLGWGDDHGDGFRHYCMRCGGLGWVAESEPVAPPDTGRR
jgi:hypothetical protein